MSFDEVILWIPGSPLRGARNSDTDPSKKKGRLLEGPAFTIQAMRDPTAALPGGLGDRSG